MLQEALVALCKLDPNHPELVRPKAQHYARSAISACVAMELVSDPFATDDWAVHRIRKTGLRISGISCRYQNYNTCKFDKSELGLCSYVAIFDLMVWRELWIGLDFFHRTHVFSISYILLCMFLPLASLLLEVSCVGYTPRAWDRRSQQSLTFRSFWIAG